MSFVTRQNRNLAWTVLATALVLLPAPTAADTSPLAYQEVEIRVEDEPRKTRIPAGYRLEVLTEKLEGPRMLTFAGNGDLFIGSKSGKVYLLPPPYREPRVLVQLEGYPHVTVQTPPSFAGDPDKIPQRWLRITPPQAGVKVVQAHLSDAA